MHLAIRVVFARHSGISLVYSQIPAPLFLTSGVITWAA